MFAKSVAKISEIQEDKDLDAAESSGVAAMVESLGSEEEGSVGSGVEGSGERSRGWRELTSSSRLANNLAKSGHAQVVHSH